MKSNYSVDVEYDVLITKIHRWGEIIRFGGQLPIEDIKEEVLNTKNLIESHRDALIAKVFGKKKKSNLRRYEIEAIDICILALVVGIDLGLDEEDLNVLGVSALLKDIGMNKISEDVINKKEGLTEQEFVEIKKHPFYSVEILKEHGIGEDIQNVVIDHHERWDGVGYPEGKRAEDISYLARIISVLDGFNAMKEERPYRKSILGYDAIKSIIGDNGHRYDPSVLNAVLKSIGIYPIGSYVALNDASICQVISTNSETPLKPVVEVIINKDGTESKSNTIIDISDNPRFFIVKNVSVN